MKAAKKELRRLLAGMVVVLSLLPMTEAVLGQEIGADESTDSELAVPLGWPREYELDNGGKLLIYQPQFERWSDNKQIRGTLALTYTRNSDESPLLGTVILDADTETDLESNLVRTYKFTLLEGTFPGLSTRDSKILTQQLMGLFPREMMMSLDRVLAGLQPSRTQQPTAVLESDPPKIFVSQSPAILVQFDGEPLWSPVDGINLKHAANTDWDVFYFEKKGTYYLLDGDAWLQASRVQGPWSAASKLPKLFGKLPGDNDDWNEVAAHVPGQQLEESEVPEVFVSPEPAELILIDGDPRLDPIADTDLSWVTNTESDLFVHAPDGAYFFLVSGRWYRAESLAGPWTFATEDLPQGFSQIPPDHAKGDVLALVPGTPDAREAAIRAQIPRQATVEGGAGQRSEGSEGTQIFVVRGVNNLYAGQDGRVYRRDEDGWHKYSDGEWGLLDPPKERQQAKSSGRETWDRNSLSEAKRRRVYNRLNWDYQNRSRGALRASEYQSPPIR
jgi:hypothetical protein